MEQWRKKWKCKQPLDYWANSTQNRNTTDNHWRRALLSWNLIKAVPELLHTYCFRSYQSVMVDYEYLNTSFFTREATAPATLDALEMSVI